MENETKVSTRKAVCSAMAIPFRQATAEGLVWLATHPDNSVLKLFLGAEGQKFIIITFITPKDGNDTYTFKTYKNTPIRSFSTAAPLTLNSLPPAVLNCDSLYFQIQT